MTKQNDTAPATRDAIIDRLKRQGELSASDLGEQLGLTAMAARLQLYDLQEESLVTSRSVPAGRGRPVKLWALTEAAEKIFPDAHQGLAVELIHSVEKIFGKDGLTKLIAAHGEKQLKTYEQLLGGAKSPGERVKKLAEVRSSEGYMAEAVKDGRDWLLIENHCPVCSAAKACTGLCANELSVFQQVLGEGLSVSREEHILKGARRCVYRVRKSARE